MRLYCYHLPPIDHWTGGMTPELFLASLAPSPGWLGTVAAAVEMLQELEASAQAAFREIGWEGDIREGPYFFALPDEARLAVGYVLKQAAEGSTFVASPIELPWLRGISRVEPTVIPHPG